MRQVSGSAGVQGPSGNVADIGAYAVVRPALEILLVVKALVVPKLVLELLLVELVSVVLLAVKLVFRVLLDTLLVVTYSNLLAGNLARTLFPTLVVYERDQFLDLRPVSSFLEAVRARVSSVKAYLEMFRCLWEADSKRKHLVLSL